MVKLNIASPVTVLDAAPAGLRCRVSHPCTTARCPTESGTQKTFELEDEKAVQMMYDKKISQEFDGGILGEKESVWRAHDAPLFGRACAAGAAPSDAAFAGRSFGASRRRLTPPRRAAQLDKQGFPMKQGILSNSRVSLLLDPGTRKSVRGCIIAGDLSVINMIIVQKGKEEIEGVTDKQHPRRLGPKRARKIMKLFDLQYGDDVRKYVIRREAKEGHTKAPKIQRLVTPVTKQRRRKRKAILKLRKEKSKEDRR
eukprot:gene50656-25477_t